VLQHVGIEVARADMDRSVEFWRALGFKRVEPPPTLREYTWLEREGTQVHLMPTEAPTVPGRGHTAIVARDFERDVAALRELGYEVEGRRQHWGAPRALAIAPGGHRVELMAKPPLAADKPS
jgi:catechol 2,3-dioxygenase-like lactoylglutathione lyase family enzyme